MEAGLDGARRWAGRSSSSGLLATRGGDDAAKPLATSTDKLDPLPASVTISLPTKATGRRVPDGFLGFSFEFQAVRTYTGSDPRAINPVFEQLIRNLSPGQDPVLRIGGDSTDVSYAPSPGVTPPPYVAYQLTPSWMATTAALAHQVGARMIDGPEPRRQRSRARRGRGPRLRPGVRPRDDRGARDRQRAQHLQPAHRRTTRCSGFRSMPGRAASAIRRFAASSAPSPAPRRS